MTDDTPSTLTWATTRVRPGETVVVDRRFPNWSRKLRDLTFTAPHLLVVSDTEQEAEFLPPVGHQWLLETVAFLKGELHDSVGQWDVLTVAAHPDGDRWQLTFAADPDGDDPITAAVEIRVPTPSLPAWFENQRQECLWDTDMELAALWLGTQLPDTMLRVLAPKEPLLISDLEWLIEHLPRSEHLWEIEMLRGTDAKSAVHDADAMFARAVDLTIPEADLTSGGELFELMCVLAPEWETTSVELLETAFATLQPAPR